MRHRPASTRSRIDRFDATYREDACKVRAEVAPRIMASLRNLAIGLLA
ncbi:hypothetical protein ACIBF6_05040 [Streptosporangium amethystogenes]